MLRLALAFVAALTAAPAVAMPMHWYISGRGTGTLDGAAWDARFKFDLYRGINDTIDTPRGRVVDGLRRATLGIHGVGKPVLELPTRLGFDSENGVVFFSRSGAAGNLDLFDFHVDEPARLRSPFAPMPGRDVFALDQFVNVPSSEGALTFLSASDVQFSAVPLPAAAPLLVVGLGGLGLLARRRRPA